MDGDELHETWVPGSRRLLIAFSGFGSHHRAWEPFNFMGVARKYNVNKMFIRDLRQAWYHHGIQRLTKNIDDTAEYISAAIGYNGIDKISLIGVSAGGYAALVFAWLLEADEAHALVPQTFVDAHSCLEYDQLIAADHLHKVYDYPDACPQYFDIRDLLRDSSNGKTAYHIHYCPKIEHDRIHAEHLADLTGVHLHQYESGGHALAVYLTRDGTLDRIMQTSLGVQPDANSDTPGARGAG